jgi:glycosyltransferase involved in cell wall biosynthesis
MRILVLPGYRYPASLEEPLTCGDLRNTFNLSRALARAGHQVVVLSRRRRGDPAAQELDGVAIRRYRGELGRVFSTSFDISARRARLFHELCRGNDAIVASTPFSLELLSSASKQPAMIYVCSGLEDTRNYGSSAGESAQRIGIRLLRDPAKRATWARAARVNTTAELEAATLLRMGVPREKILTIGPGVELERYQPSSASAVRAAAEDILPSPARGRPIVLSVSRFTPAKGIVETIGAFARLREHVPDAYLLLVGVRHTHRTDYPRQMRHAIASRGLDNHVGIVENVPESRLPACYSAAGVTSVFSVGYDPLPTTIIESMACGTPVVATDFVTRVQMIESGRDGMLVRERDEQGWAAAVGRILRDEQHAAALRDRALARVRDQFDMNRVAQRYVQALTSIPRLL